MVFFFLVFLSLVVFCVCFWFCFASQSLSFFSLSAWLSVGVTFFLSPPMLGSVLCLSLCLCLCLTGSLSLSLSAYLSDSLSACLSPSLSLSPPPSLTPFLPPPYLPLPPSLLPPSLSLSLSFSLILCLFGSALSSICICSSFSVLDCDVCFSFCHCFQFFLSWSAEF